MDNNTNQTEQLEVKDDQQKADKKLIKINKKTIIIIAIIIAVGVLAYIYKGLFVAAVVDGSPISRLAVINELEKSSGKNLLDSLITEKIIQNEVNAKGIIISDDEINTTIKNIEDQISAQGSTLDEALTMQGMTLEDLKKQLILQLELEKLVADKINVTDEEITQYIQDNSISIPEGQEEIANIQIREELKNQKINTESSILISSLKSQANILYFINY